MKNCTGMRNGCRRSGKITCKPHKVYVKTDFGTGNGVQIKSERKGTGRDGVMAYIKLTDTDRQEIIRLRQDGVPVKKIAQLYGVSKKTVSKTANKGKKREITEKVPMKIPKEILQEWDEVTGKLRKMFEWRKNG